METFYALKNSANQPKSTSATCTLGYLWSTSSDPHQVVEIQEKTSAKMNTTF